MIRRVHKANESHDLIAWSICIHGISDFISQISFSPIYSLCLSCSLVIIFSLSLLYTSNLYLVCVSFTSLTFLPLTFSNDHLPARPVARSSCHSIASASLFSTLSPRLHLHSLDAASLHLFLHGVSWPFSRCRIHPLLLRYPAHSPTRTREKEWREMTVARDGKSRYPSTANPSFLSEVIGCAAQ